VINTDALQGCAVRGPHGERGRILAISIPWIDVGWEQRSRFGLREESILHADPRFDTAIEVLTLDQGWVPMGRLLGLEEAESTGVPQLLMELRELTEAGKKKKGSKHYPFKNKGSLGPGPRGGTNKKTGNYKCKCSDYSCNCKGPDGNLKINIDRGYKRAYNQAYKAWHSFHNK
jgi:hypothetical protein